MKKRFLNLFLIALVGVSLTSTFSVVSCKPVTKEMKKIEEINYSKIYKDGERQPGLLLRLIINDFENYNGDFIKVLFNLNNGDWKNSDYIKLVVNKQNDVKKQYDILTKDFASALANKNFEEGLMYSLVVKVENNNGPTIKKIIEDFTNSNDQMQPDDSIKIKDLLNFDFTQIPDKNNEENFNKLKLYELTFIANIFTPIIEGIQAPIFNVWNQYSKLKTNDSNKNKLVFNEYLKNKIKDNEKTLLEISDETIHYLNK